MSATAQAQAGNREASRPWSQRWRSLAGGAGVPTVAVATMTVLGFALRVSGFGESLFGDELSTYAGVRDAGGPGAVVDLISTDRTVIELTPPLFFVLAWASAQLGDAVELIRLPSLIAGTLMIPLVYRLGLRTVGPSAALVGAALVTISPFLVFYSTDARSYMLATVLVLASTLALLRAAETRAPAWWAAYAIASCAAVYSHYIVVFALAAQGLWALWVHRESWRPLIVANVAAAVGFLPWLPEYLDDNSSPFNLTEALHPFSLETAAKDVADWSIGMPPLAGIPAVPGRLAAILIAAGLVLALGAVVIGILASRGPGWRRPPPELGLVVVLALATPLGMAIYSAIGTDILYSRIMIFSSPGLALAIGALVTAPRFPLRAVSVGLVIVGFAVGLVRSLDDANRRPDYKGAADLIEAQTAPTDPVYDVVFFGSPDGPLAQSLSIYLPDRAVEHPTDTREVAASVHGGRVAVVLAAPEDLLDSLGVTPQSSAAPELPRRFRLVDARRFSGGIDVGVYIFEDEPARSG